MTRHSKKGCIRMVPKNGRQTKYLLSDGANARIYITIRGTPITGKPSLGRVVDHLKCPTELSNNVGILQCGHIWMCPSMDGNIILVCLESNIELLPIIDDMPSDEKVSRPDSVLLKKCVEVIGWLYKHGKIGCQKSDEA